MLQALDLQFDTSTSILETNDNDQSKLQCMCGVSAPYLASWKVGLDMYMYVGRAVHEYMAPIQRRKRTISLTVVVLSEFLKVAVTEEAEE